MPSRHHTSSRRVPALKETDYDHEISLVDHAGAPRENDVSPVPQVDGGEDGTGAAAGGGGGAASVGTGGDGSGSPLSPRASTTNRGQTGMVVSQASSSVVVVGLSVSQSASGAQYKSEPRPSAVKDEARLRPSIEIDLVQTPSPGELPAPALTTGPSQRSSKATHMRTISRATGASAGGRISAYYDDEEVESAIDVLWENERGLLCCGIPLFSAAALGNLDPPAWTNVANKASASDTKTAQCPDPSWEWAWPEWRVNREEGVPTDAEGWEYAFMFRRFKWHKPRWWNSFVRRRAWIRRRLKVNPPFEPTADPLLLNPEYFTVRPASDVALAHTRSASRSHPHSHTPSHSRSPSDASAARSSIDGRAKGTGGAAVAGAPLPAAGPAPGPTPRSTGGLASPTSPRAGKRTSIYSRRGSSAAASSVGDANDHNVRQDNKDEPEVDANGIPAIIDCVDTLMEVLRRSRIDREKIEAVDNFLANAPAGTELSGLADEMHEIMSLFVFQASRKVLLARLMEVYEQAMEEVEREGGVVGENQGKGKEVVGKPSEGPEKGQKLVETATPATKDVPSEETALDKPEIAGKGELDTEEKAKQDQEVVEKSKAAGGSAAPTKDVPAETMPSYADGPDEKTASEGEPKQTPAPQGQTNGHADDADGDSEAAVEIHMEDHDEDEEGAGKGKGKDVATPPTAPTTPRTGVAPPSPAAPPTSPPPLDTSFAPLPPPVLALPPTSTAEPPHASTLASQRASQRASDLAAAVRHADEEVRSLEYWSDVKGLADAGAGTAAVDPAKGWEDGRDGGWAGLDRSGPGGPRTPPPRQPAKDGAGGVRLGEPMACEHAEAAP